MRNFIFLLFMLPMLSAHSQNRYTEESTELKTANGTIHGSLIVPDDNKSRCVALIISGSGPTDRNGNTAVPNMPQNNSLKYLAEGLAEQGIATLRYDKRGIAASTDAGKNEADLRLDDYVDDARAWTALLGKDRRFRNVAVIGHSEGSLIGMLACQNNKKVCKFVSLAGSGRPADKIIEEQLAVQAGPFMKTIKQINDSLRHGITVKDIPPMLMSLYRPSVQPYMISWFRYDPQHEIAKLDIPVMILQGDTDIQVSVKDAGLLKAARPDAQMVIINNMNHVLKECATMDKTEQMLKYYTDPALPVKPDLANTIARFLKEK